MQKLIHDNLPLVIGIALPLLVVFFFLLATVLPRWFVEPPQYDFLFTSSGPTSYEGPAVRLDVSVNSENTLRVRVFKTDSRYTTKPRLLIFEHETQSVREIPIDIPANVNQLDDGHEIVIEELRGRTLSTNRRAPDGYELSGPEYRGGDFFGLFYGGRRHRFSISKGSATIPLKAADTPYYYGVNFLGWVID